MKSHAASEKEEKIYLEAVRVIAIFLVMYGHTGYDASERYQVVTTGFSYWMSILITCLAHCSAPALFMMVSGATLLQKTDTLKTAVMHRALRVLEIILLFGFLQYVYCYYQNPEITFSIPTFFYLLYSTNVITPYWYIYAYFVMMLILPFLQMLAHSMEKIHFWYLFGLYFVMEGILPIVEVLWGNSRIALSVPLFDYLIFFPLMGYYLEHKSGDFFYKKSTLLVANLGGIAALAVSMIAGNISALQRGHVSFLEGMIALISVVIFVDVKAFCHYAELSSGKIWHNGFTRVLKKGIALAGAGVFGVYLFEPQMREGLHFIYVALEPYLTWFLASVIWISTAILCGVILFHILKRVPVFRKLL